MSNQKSKLWPARGSPLHQEINRRRETLSLALVLRPMGCNHGGDDGSLTEGAGHPDDARGQRPHRRQELQLPDGAIRLQEKIRRSVEAPPLIRRSRFRFLIECNCGCLQCCCVL